MSSTARAEQAVTEARARLHRSLLLVAAGDEPLPKALDTSLDDLVRAVEARCAERHCRCYPHPNDHEDDCPQHAALIDPDAQEQS